MQLQTHATPAQKPGSHFIEASIQGLRYAAYPDSIGGVILARISDGWSTYIVRGKEAQAFFRGVYDAQDHAEDGESPGEAFDRAAADYDGLMEAPTNMHGAPDSFGDFWHWAAPDRRAA